MRIRLKVNPQFKARVPVTQVPCWLLVDGVNKPSCGSICFCGLLARRVEPLPTSFWTEVDISKLYQKADGIGSQLPCAARGNNMPTLARSERAH